jgi:5-methylcytosine-specific restriction endonuclease McrA
MFNLNPAPKPNHNRRTPKRAQRGEFTPLMRKEIYDRDQGLCVRCGRVAVHIHHIVYRSQGGGNDKRNGVCVCHSCHEHAHGSKEGRGWFEFWRDKYLDESGELIELPFSEEEEDETSYR